MSMSALALAVALLVAPSVPVDSLDVEGRDARWSGVVPPGAAIEIQNVSGEILAERSESDEVEVEIQRFGAAWETVRLDLVMGADGSVSICAIADDAEYLEERGYSAELGPKGCVLGGGGRLGGVGRDESDVGVSFVVRVPEGVSFRAHTYDGDIEAALPGAISAFTSDGDIYLDLSTVAWSGPVDLRTNDGDVSVRLAEGTGVEVDAFSRFGRVRTDLPVFRDPSTGAVYGRVGDGSRGLKIRTTEGTVRIRTAGL